MNEVTTDWLIESGEPLQPTNETQLSSELLMLKDLAKNVGLYDYNYTEEAMNDENLPGTDSEEHIGIMAQQLLNVPGLASAVKTTIDENGKETYVVDGNKVALAALGYIAALSKIVLDMRGVKINDDTSTDNAPELQTGEGDTEVPAIGTETGNSETGAANGYEESGISQGSAVQAGNSSGIDSATSTSGLNSSVYNEVE